MMLFSVSTQGFYVSGIGPKPPLDAVELSSETYQQALWLRSKSKIVSISTNGEVLAEDPVVAPVIPKSITPRQGLLILSRLGLLDEVKTAIANMEGQSGDEARIEWEYATSWERSWPLLVSVASGLGLTTEQIDDIFIQAAQI